MAYTIQQVVTLVQRRMPDAQTSALVTYCNTVHRRLLSEIPELRMDTVSLNLVDGTSEYDIAEPVFQVQNVDYVTGAGAATKLAATTLEVLNATRPGWREDPAGTPQEFYLSSNQLSGNSEVIGLYPAPAESTSGSYPVLQMWISELQAADLGLSDTCLITLSSSQVYVEGASYYAALEIRPQMAGAWKSNYEIEVASEKAYVRSRNGDQATPFIQNSRGGNYPAPAPKGTTR
jgi:hypothetical protein